MSYLIGGEPGCAAPPGVDWEVMRRRNDYRGRLYVRSPISWLPHRQCVFGRIKDGVPPVSSTVAASRPRTAVATAPPPKPGADDRPKMATRLLLGDPGVALLARLVSGAVRYAHPMVSVLRSSASG